MNDFEKRVENRRKVESWKNKRSGWGSNPKPWARNDMKGARSTTGVAIHPLIKTQPRVYIIKQIFENLKMVPPSSSSTLSFFIRNFLVS